jgi:hypothetical protein
MRAPSYEQLEQEAPTAKIAKHEEQIRVQARDGEEVTLSRDAARLMGTLRDLMDLAASEDGTYPLPTIVASTLRMVGSLNDPDYTWPSSDEHSLFQLLHLVEDTLFLDAPSALKHLEDVACVDIDEDHRLDLTARPPAVHRELLVGLQVDPDQVVQALLVLLVHGVHHVKQRRGRGTRGDNAPHRKLCSVSAHLRRVSSRRNSVRPHGIELLSA